MNLCTESDQKFHHFGMASLAGYEQGRSTILESGKKHKQINQLVVWICFI